MPEIEIPEIFKYETPTLPEDAWIGISPSSINKFFTYPKTWYQENMLGEAPEFKGNTATVTGTICHYIYESVTLGNKITREVINEQLSNWLTICPNSDVDINEVINTYPLVSAAVVNDYVLPHNTVKNIKVEQQIVAKYRPHVYIKGTFDRLEGTTLCDYKTVAKQPTGGIPFNYKMQLMAYAWALRANGNLVENIRLIYGIKPTKTIPARCYVVTEPISYDLEQEFKNCLDLITETVYKVKEDPSLAYLMFKSMDLKKED